MMKKYFKIAGIFITLFGTHLAFPKDNLKVLVLIIASDQFPVYIELQKIWKSYMHYNPQQVEAYFIRADPNLSNPFKIQGDIIWARTSEGWTPESAGIINKTILAMEAMLPRLNEFDYVLRTNLSSFYIFPRLLNFLKQLPKTRCYAGSGEDILASGSGFIISPDIVRLLVKNKHSFLDHNLLPDDVLIAHFLNKQGIKRIHHERLDLIKLSIWNSIKHAIPSNIFHFRVKNPDHLRLTDELYIQTQLLNMFYPKKNKLI